MNTDDESAAGQNAPEGTGWLERLNSPPCLLGLTLIVVALGVFPVRHYGLVAGCFLAIAGIALVVRGILTGAKDA